MLIVLLLTRIASYEYYQSEREIRELHTMSRVNTVSWSPDGGYVAGAALLSEEINEVLILWNTSNLTNSSQIPIPNTRPWSVAWRHAGDLIATGGQQGEINLVQLNWGNLKESPITKFPMLHTTNVNDIEWVSDGSLFVSVSYDGSIGVWNLTHLVRHMRHSAEAIQDVDCNNFLCLTSSKDHSIKLWDVSTGELLQVYSEHTAMVNTVAWSPEPQGKDPSFVSVSDDGQCIIWSYNGTVHNKLETGSIMQSVDWCSDNRIAVASMYGDIQLWLPWSPVPLYEHSSVRDAIAYSIRWNHGCTRLAIGDPASMSIFDGTPGPLMDVHGEWNKLFVAADWYGDKPITAMMYEGGLVQIRDSHTWNATQTPPSELRCQIPWSLMRLSPDATLLVYAICSLTTLRLWNISDNSTKCILLHNNSDFVHSMDWSVDEWLAVGTTTGNLIIWNTQDCTVVSVQRLHTRAISAITCNYTKGSCVSASEDGTIMMTDSLLPPVSQSFALVKALEWYNNILAIGHAEGVTLWLTNGSSQKPKLPATGVSALAWDQATGLLAVGTSTGEVHVWNPKLNESKPLIGQLSDILALKWTRDGSQLAAAGREGHITWWNRSMFDIWWIDTMSLQPDKSAIVGFPFGFEIRGEGLKPGWGQLQTRDTETPHWLIFTTSGNATHLTANLTGFKHRVYELRLYCEEASPPWALVFAFIPKCPLYSTAIGLDEGECACLPTYYSEDNDGRNCSTCPGTAACSEVDTTLENLKAANGYWRNSTAQLPPFQRCPISACVGGTCELGYEGVLCGTCAPGYAQARFNNCGKCPPLWQNALLILGHVLFIGVVVIIQSLLALRAPKRNVWGQLASILVSSAQVNAMILNLDVELPSFVETIVRAQGSSQGAPNSIYSLSCAAVKRGWNTNSVFYLKLHLAALMPPLCYILVRLGQCIGSTTYCARAKCWGGRRAFWLSKRVPFVTTVVLFYTIYPSICAQVFQLWSCRLVDTGASPRYQYRLSSDLSVVCYDTRYWLEFGLVGLPVTFLYIVAAPLFATWRLSKIQGALLLGFLSRPFTHYWWFLVVVARKLVLAAISCFLWAHTPLQLFLCTTCLLFCLVLQVHHRPFTEPAANYAEAISLTMSCLTYSCCILVYFVPFVPFDNSYAGTILMAFPLGYLGIFGLAVLECRAAHRNTSFSSSTESSIKNGYVPLLERDHSFPDSEKHDVDRHSFPDANFDVES